MRTETEQDYDIADSANIDGPRRSQRAVLGAVLTVAVIVAAFAWAVTRRGDDTSAPAAVAGASVPSTAAPTSTLSPSTAPTATAAPTTTPAPATYTGTAYPLVLQYPADWQLVAGDPSPSFEGDGGFLRIGGTASADSVDEVCRAQAAGQLPPFGTTPAFETVTVGGQEACLILPSADQPSATRGTARVVVRLPYELFSVGFNFLVLDGDVDHVRAIAMSIEFLGHD
jgi:hypothetical protein